MNEALLRRVTSCIVLAALALSPLGALRLAAREDEPTSKSDAVDSGGSLRAFRAGTVWTGDAAAISKGVVLVRDGKIVAVQAADVALPAGAEVVDLGDEAVITPALINCLSQAHRLGSNLRSRRSGAVSSARVSRRDARKLTSIEQIRPSHKIYARLGELGWGAVAIPPSNGGFLAGRAVVVSPRKTKEREELVLVDDGYLYMGYELGQSFRKFAEGHLKKAIEAAKKFREARKKAAEARKKAQETAKKEGKPKQDEAQKKPSPTPPQAGKQQGAKPSTPAKAPEPDALTEVFLGQRDVVLFADSRAVIDHWLRLLESLPEAFEFILVTSSFEADYVERLAGHRKRIRGVILEPRMGRIDDTSILINTARYFVGERIPVAFVPMSDDVVGHESIFYYLAELVKCGLSEEQALRAVTATPARFLGIDDRLGTLQEGRDASFVVFDGDPFSGLAEISRVVRQGETVVPADDDEEDADDDSEDEDASQESDDAADEEEEDEEEPESSTAVALEAEGEDGDGETDEETDEKQTAKDTGKESSEKPAEKPESGKPEEVVHAIVGGTVHPVTGPPIHRGTVLFRGGKILAVGSELTVPEGAEIHSAEGAHVTPGLVVVEASVSNARYSGGNYQDALDPYHRDLRIALANGITTLQVIRAPFFGGFGGSMSAPSGNATAVIKSTVGDLEGMLVKEPSSIYLSFRRSMASIYDLREKFARAREYLDQVQEAEKNKKKPPRMPRGLNVYVDILKDEVPTFCAVSDRETAEILLDLKERYGFGLVLAEGGDTWKIASRLTALDVPILVKSRGPDFLFDLQSPVIDEDGMIPIRVPVSYAEKGAHVALLPYRRGISLNGLAGRDLSAYAFEAAFAVRGGMDEGSALRTITLEPARCLRVDDRVGSLEKGKDADILIWSGEPLHYRSFVKTAWINGKVYYEREKSRLYRPIPIQR